MSRIAAIAAIAENGVIGNRGMLPWGRMPADLQRFQQLTMGHHLLMGRKTWDSVARPLPGRPVIVITRSQLELPAGVSAAATVDEAIERALAAGDDEPFIAGGAEIYRAAMPRVERLYLTDIHGRFEGDTVFPEYDPTPWHLREYADYPADERNPYPYSFRTYDRASPPVVSSLANSSG
jgi:dihydrofolate reductase